MFLALLLLSIVQPGALSTREFDILGGLSINPRLTRPHYYVIDHDGWASKFNDQVRPDIASHQLWTVAKLGQIG